MTDKNGFVVTYNMDQLAQLCTEDARRHKIIQQYETLTVVDFSIKTNTDLDKFLKVELQTSRFVLN